LSGQPTRSGDATRSSCPLLFRRSHAGRIFHPKPDFAMKKIPVALLFAWASFGAVGAQNPTGANPKLLRVTATNAGTPTASVLRTLHRDLPASAAEDLAFFLPGDAGAETWTVREQPRRVDGNLPATYHVLFTDPQVRYSATYDHNGELLRYTELVRHTDLPAAVRTALRAHFPQWRLLDDQERLRLGGAFSTTYRVDLAKGHRRERVVFDGHGRLLGEVPQSAF